MKKNYKLLLLLVLPCVMFSQEYTYIDFGSPNTGYPTSGNWNNITTAVNNETGITSALINSTGTATGVTLSVNDPFDINNTAGYNQNTAGFVFPATATRDSFFGETVAFNGNTQPTGGFILTGLNPAYYYSFSIFASRSGVTDNRETQYTLTGLTPSVVSLNPSNNSTNTVEVVNLQPNANGEITLVAQPGPNNNNSSGFYYLGAIEMIASSTALSNDSFKLKSVLELYPNPINEFFEINFNLETASDVKIDLYDINGKLLGNLYHNKQSSGEFIYKWEKGNSNINVVSGFYLINLQVNGVTHTEKVYIK